MKTKSEVLDHLLKNGYNKKAISKIAGFMVGKELKEPNEIIQVQKGELTFDDFLNWFNSIDKDVKDSNEEWVELELGYCPKCVIESLLDDVALRLLNVRPCDTTLANRLEKQLEFLDDMWAMFSDIENQDED